MSHKQRYILPVMERKALDKLWRDKSISSLQADKGRATVGMDKAEYNCKAHAILDDTNAYKVVTKDLMT